MLFRIYIYILRCFILHFYFLILLACRIIMQFSLKKNNLKSKSQKKISLVFVTAYAPPPGRSGHVFSREKNARHKKRKFDHLKLKFDIFVVQTLNSTVPLVIILKHRFYCQTYIFYLFVSAKRLFLTWRLMGEKNEKWPLHTLAAGTLKSNQFD